MDLIIKTDAGNIVKKLDGLSEARLKTWIAYAEKSEAVEFAEYIRDYWLNGQALAKVTGRTRDSVQSWTRKRDKRVFVRPGVGVPGSLNYLARWDGKSGHEFMMPAWRKFSRGNRIENAVLENIDRMLKEVMEG